MLRKFILTVALAAMYQGDPAQLGGSLLTIFIFLVLHMLIKPYLNQGLNIFQRLALISQWFTVFGGLMFVVTELLALQNTLPDESGQTILSWLILFVNTVAIFLYPLYRFFSAWSESGETDLSFVEENFLKCLDFFGGTQLIVPLMYTCGILRKVNDAGEKVKTLLPVVDRVRDGDLKGALALVPTVPVVQCLINLDPELTRSVLEKIFMEEEFQAAVSQTKTSRSDLGAPLEELERFVKTLEAQSELRPEELVEGLQSVDNAFKGVGNFKFPADLLTSIDPIDVLKTIGSVIPPPLHGAYMQALDVIGQAAVLLPVVDRVRGKDLKGPDGVSPKVSAPPLRLGAYIGSFTRLGAEASSAHSNGLTEPIEPRFNWTKRLAGEAIKCAPKPQIPVPSPAPPDDFDDWALGDGVGRAGE